MIYLDSAALVKLVRAEDHSAELVGWLGERAAEPLVASALVEVEVPRALRRHAPEALPGVSGVLARLYLLEINSTVRATAGTYEDPSLRSLGAIHLATAQLLATEDAELDAFVSYDVRLLAAARANGLPIVSPGVS